LSAQARYGGQGLGRISELLGEVGQEVRGLEAIDLVLGLEEFLSKGCLTVFPACSAFACTGFT